MLQTENQIAKSIYSTSTRNVQQDQVTDGITEFDLHREEREAIERAHKLGSYNMKIIDQLESFAAQASFLARKIECNLEKVNISNQHPNKILMQQMLDRMHDLESQYFRS